MTHQLNDTAITLPERAMIAINLLKEAGVGSVLYYVSGSGDSPDDHSLHFYEDPDAARECNDSHGVGVNEWADKARNAGLTELVLSDFCWEVLSEYCNDYWYNNEGGYGYVWICAGERPQVGCTLYEYPEPEAERTGRAVVAGAPLADEDGG